MRLPALSVIIGLQAVLWCIAGFYILGPEILLYPLIWTLVIGGFLLHLKLNPLRHQTTSEATPSVVKAPPQVEETPPTVENSPQKLAAS